MLVRCEKADDCDIDVPCKHRVEHEERDECRYGCCYPSGPKCIRVRDDKEEDALNRVVYWARKVEKAVKISKEYGYDSYDEEFWERQPAGVISLIIDVRQHPDPNAPKK